ncbi:MMPL family transporter [Streptomyces sp. LP05-1]|uniref:MMPL family transporter n=1 Tax=Streptomyces pyxinae TaxID=2970734 RepID=A0ABT2CME6_9ACTN|nr:MMPL family transporter [Streptomyces sp. LP05-1]MCS0638606.1 MMPL family transporter [Streptomyces sp. LP05-1]
MAGLRTHKGRTWVMVWTLLVLAASLAIAVGHRQLRGIAPEAEGTSSAHAAGLIARGFPEFGTEQLVLAFDSRTLRSGDALYLGAVGAAVTAVTAEPGVGKELPVTAPPGIDPRHAYAFVGVQGDTDARQRLLPRWRAAAERAAAAASGGRVSVAMTGLTPVFAELHRSDMRDLRRLELVTVPLAVLLLVLGLRSVAGALVVVAAAGMSVLLSSGVLSALALAVPVDSVVLTVSTTVGFGLGLDYALLLLLRYRDFRARGLDPREAAAHARASAGRAVLWCAGALVVAAAALCTVPLALVRTIGLAAALTTVTTTATTAVALPALLPRLDRLLIRGGRPDARRGRPGSDRWERWARHLVRRPWPYLLATLVVLALAIAPIGGFRLGLTVDRTAIEHSAAGAGLDQLERDGLANATLLALPHPADEGAVDTDALVTWLQGDPRIITAVALDNGTDLTLVLIGDRVPVDSAGSVRLLREVRSVAARTLPPGQPLYVTGQTATLNDFDIALRAALRQVAAVCAGACFLLMLVAFRSLLIPVKALLMNGLATAAAFGVLAWYTGRTGEPVNTAIPVLALTIVFGLSLDYEVFLVHRITAHHRAGAECGTAIVRGLSETARPITLAALTMATVFAGLLTTHRQDFRQMGLLVTVAVLLDATLIRMVLVPTLIRLLGPLNWWLPRPLRRLLPLSAPRVLPPQRTAAPPGGRPPAAPVAHRQGETP